MMRMLKSIRFKVVVLAILAVLTYHTSVNTGQANAVRCEKCVYPTGGICVACMETQSGEEGIVPCTPDQDTCKCVDTDISCVTGIDP